jgi:hypothetical protein
MSASLPSLRAYVVQRNARAKVFGKKQFDVDALTAKDAQSIADMLACDLSPENLSCDGEASPSSIKSKAAFLNKACAELRTLFSVEIAY